MAQTHTVCDVQERLNPTSWEVKGSQVQILSSRHCGLGK